MTIAKAGRYGIQPCKRLIVGIRSTLTMHSSSSGGRPGTGVPALAARLSELVGWEVRPRTLRAWLDGYAIPPAEVKLGVAQVLGVPVEKCWTPEVLAATYSGPRGVSTRDG